MSFAKNLVIFAREQKSLEENEFDSDRDKMIIVFDGDIFEEKVQGYDELITSIEERDIAAVSNPGFELFLLLHIDGSFEKYIKGHEAEFMTMIDGKYAYAYNILLEATGMNAKKNSNIGNLAENVMTAINQERLINQDIHRLKGKVSSNIGVIIEGILNEEPDI
ncbi:MAG: RloB domain-containing protein [Lachnospiraceae bacterium]|nr:RloB domain-containing protein [Lachnospiraceae bacterium]